MGRTIKQRRRRLQKGGNRTVAESSHPGYGSKSAAKDQDRGKILHVGEYTILCVFDGHGPAGHIISDFVNNQLPALVQSKLTPGLASDAIQTILTESFATCSTAVNAKSEARASGTTATVAVITPTHIVVANAGDSPALLFDKKGTLLANTNDHDYENDAERKRVLAAGGRWEKDSQGIFRLNGTLMTSRGFGDLSVGSGKSDVPELYSWPNTPDTYVSVSSDSFAEALVGSNIKPLNGPKEMVAELYGALSSERFDIGKAARRAVHDRVERFGPTAFGGDEYFGDNTILLLANTTDTATVTPPPLPPSPPPSLPSTPSPSPSLPSTPPSPPSSLSPFSPPPPSLPSTSSTHAPFATATITSTTATKVAYTKDGFTVTCGGASRKSKTKSKRRQNSTRRHSRSSRR